MDGEVGEPYAAIAASWSMGLAEELDQLRHASAHLCIRSEALRKQAAQLRAVSEQLRAGLQD